MFIDSEIKNLKKVIVHKPSHSLMKITHYNCDDFLFDDAVWPEKANEEHDNFVSLLKENNVEVFFIEKLLEEAIKNPEAKNYLIKRMIKYNFQCEYVKESLFQYLSELSLENLIENIFGGMTYRDISPYSLGLTSYAVESNQFVLPPLLNLVFMRDPCSVINNKLYTNNLAYSIRKPEVAIISTVKKYHPLFKTSEIDENSPEHDEMLSPCIEGGDILVINSATLLIGIGQRTQPQAVEMLARKLFRDKQVKKIIALKIPSKRNTMHLDTLLTMLNYDTFYSFYPDLNFEAWAITPGESDTDLIIEKEKNLINTLCRILEVKKLQIITPIGDSFAWQREQWNDGVNLLTIKPGLVVSYAQNNLINAQLKNAGIATLPVFSSELSRGRGGPRCMVCPLSRE